MQKSFPNKIPFVQQDKTIIFKIYAVIFRNLILNKIFIHNLFRKYDYTVCMSTLQKRITCFLYFLYLKHISCFILLYKKNSVRTEKCLLRNYSISNKKINFFFCEISNNGTIAKYKHVIYGYGTWSWTEYVIQNRSPCFNMYLEFSQGTWKWTTL